MNKKLCGKLSKADLGEEQTEGKLEHMATEMGEVRLFLGKWDHQTSQRCCVAAWKLV